MNQIQLCLFCDEVTELLKDTELSGPKSGFSNTTEEVKALHFYCNLETSPNVYIREGICSDWGNGMKRVPIKSTKNKMKPYL